MKWIKRFFEWWNRYTEDYCPHCGYYCTGKSIFCAKHREALEDRLDIEAAKEALERGDFIALDDLTTEQLLVTCGHDMKGGVLICAKCYDMFVEQSSKCKTCGGRGLVSSPDFLTLTPDADPCPACKPMKGAKMFKEEIKKIKDTLVVATEIKAHQFSEDYVQGKIDGIHSMAKAIPVCGKSIKGLNNSQTTT